MSGDASGGGETTDNPLTPGYQSLPAQTTVATYATGHPYATTDSLYEPIGLTRPVASEGTQDFSRPTTVTPGGGRVARSVGELLAFQTDPTFFRPLSRVEAEQLLLSYPTDAALARPSSTPGASTTPGTATPFALSFRKGGQCYHVRVDLSTDRSFPLLQTCNEVGVVSVYGSIASLLEHLEVTRIRGEDATYGVGQVQQRQVRTYGNVRK
jgi:hypothetical protein